MNNLKKIGLSALAGALVAFSANAVEMSVSGVAEVTYTTSGGDGSAPTGNPFGSNTSAKPPCPWKVIFLIKEASFIKNTSIWSLFFLALTEFVTSVR